MTGGGAAAQAECRPRRRAAHTAAAAAAASCLCLTVPASTANAGTLDIRFEYGRTFDAACSLLRGYPIEPDWRSDLQARLPAMRALWAREGYPVLERMFELSGRRLHGRRTIRTTLCDLPSSSLLGASVNMRHALPSYTRTPVPLRYKVSVANHELLHSLLADVDLKDSRMLAAHAAEPPRVRSHLHLFALLKAAMLDLGQEAALEEMQRIDGRLPGGAYRRAWQLVNRTPHEHLLYIAELRGARPRSLAAVKAGAAATGKVLPLLPHGPVRNAGPWLVPRRGWGSLT